MESKDTRTIALVGQDDFDKIKKARIAIVGVGGVGGAATEMLFRAGASHLRLIDYDVFDATNLNRQLGSLISNIGKSKVESFKERFRDIGNTDDLELCETRLNEDNIDSLLKDCDYILDMCDDVSAKVAIINYAYKHKIFSLSAMGAGKRIDISKLEYTTLDKTRYCQLAKKLRRYVPKQIAHKTRVLFYDSELLDSKTNKNLIGTISYAPNYMGIRAAEIILKKIMGV